MKISGMAEFQDICKGKLRDWYQKTGNGLKEAEEVYIVWACKTLQNYKCLASTSVPGDGIYAEYTYNGDLEELYEDVYAKVQNTRYKE